VLGILSSLIFPLTFGVLTIFITLYQHIRTENNRTKDLERFRIERQEDRNGSRIQREQDLHIAQLQRKQDWNMEKTNQETQNKVASNRYQDDVVQDYIKQIGDLMKENNGSLTANRLTAALARVKTLNVLRQLDESRQIHIVRFLFEARQFTNADGFDPLDISTAELTNIDFRKFTKSSIIERISLAGVSLRNCGFGEETRIEHVNFTSTHFHHVNFSSAILKTVDFSFANIVRVSFSSATIWTTNFSCTVFRNVNFSSTSLVNIDFSLALLHRITFSLAELDGVNFSSAQLIDVDFSSVHFGMNDLNILFINDIQFFLIVGFPSSNFRHAQMNHIIFEKCDCQRVDFSYANLAGSVFCNANLRSASFQNAVLTQANFSHANLCDADFTNTTITDSQLESALSIRNAKLPNGTLGRTQNLIENGDANCNIESLYPWQVQNGNIAVVASKKHPNDCQFVLKSHVIGATMCQRIRLVDVWDFTIRTDSNVELHFYHSSGVSIELNGLSNNGTIIHTEVHSMVE
jgi:uncharacterized protein YjbI with pentapeptide repeats